MPTYSPRAYLQYELGALSEAFQRLHRQFAQEEVARRLWARDHTLWKPEPQGVADLLGWLQLPHSMTTALPELTALQDECASFEQVVLLGMGGSSLGAETLATMLGDRPLIVLDSTHPAVILDLERGGELTRTLFIVASKSGTTLETNTHLAYFFHKVGKAKQFIAITDPGTPLEALARARSFRKVLLTPPEVGGRYSVLSYFGLVPAALVGVDVAQVLASAQEMASACGPESRAEENPGVWLGALLAAAAGAGHDKLTLHLSEQLKPIGPWLEQLIAESMGKEGTGIVPVTDEPPGRSEVYGDDRLHIGLGTTPPLQPYATLPWDGVQQLGGELFRWEIATAVAGHGLGINPFDQPEVESAKTATSAALAGQLPSLSSQPSLEALLTTVRPGDYLALQAFLPRTLENHARLQAIRARLRDRFCVATTLEFGPRYLHSTGQLHKGGPPSVLCVQILDHIQEDVRIPDKPYSYGQLLTAQADGDLAALKERGRRVARILLPALEELVSSY